MMLDNSQVLTIAFSTLPVMLTVLLGTLVSNVRLSRADWRPTGSLDALDASLAEFRSHMDARFDEMDRTCRADVRHLEEVLDARLRHLEER